MKKLILILFCSVSLSSAYAQTYSTPKDYTLETEDDYAKYEGDVIAAFDYLMEAQPLKNVGKRKSAMKFLVAWASGSPNVTITLFSELLPDTEGEYLGILFGGWIKRALQAEGEISTFDGYLAGIDAVLTYYEKNKEIVGTSKSIEKFVKLKKKGKLEKYIQDHIEE